MITADSSLVEGGFDRIAWCSTCSKYVEAMENYEKALIEEAFPTRQRKAPSPEPKKSRAAARPKKRAAKKHGARKTTKRRSR